MRPAALAITLAFAGCQCLVPVDDHKDAGSSTPCRTAGDCPSATSCSGGSPVSSEPTCINSKCGRVEAVCPLPDGGPAPDAGHCTAAAQCVGTQAPTTHWCDTSDAGPSCIARNCLWECPRTGAGRSCSVDAGCLSCDGGTFCPIDCPGAGTYAATVEAGSACTVWPGTTIAFSAVTIQRTASARCNYTAYQAAGVEQLGDFWRLSNDEYLAYFPSMGGWCTGRSADTGAPRAIFNCPRCQFVLMGFE